jgi:hypothetical protein
MRAAVFETLAPWHRWALAAYRAVGFETRYLRVGPGVAEADWFLRSEGKTLRRLSPEPLAHVGSREHRQPAIDVIGPLFDARFAARGPVLSALDLWRTEDILLAFSKRLLFELVEAFRVAALLGQCSGALREARSIHFIPAEIRDAWRYVGLGSAFPTPPPANARLPIWLCCAALAQEMFLRAAGAGYALWNWAKALRRLLLREGPRGDYDTAVAVHYPYREWSRGMDFLIDGKTVRRERTLFVPLAEIGPEDEDRFAREGLVLADFPGRPAPSELARTAPGTLDLALLWPLTPSWLVDAAGRVLKERLLWTGFLGRRTFKNWVSYCDFLPAHVPRNILLREAGVRTVYLTDSINSGNIWETPENAGKCRYEHWTFLLFDLFVSWCEDYTRYQRTHAQRIGAYADVGCLWADEAVAMRDGLRPQPLAGLLEAARGLRVVSAFDSTYHDHGAAKYKDGIAFLEGLLRLLDDEPGLFLLFKEKIPRGMLGKFSFDPAELRRMRELHALLEGHPRCRIAGGAAACVAASEIAIAFPFSSAAAFALTAERKALFFDPLGAFGRSYFDGFPGLVARGYPEMLSRVRALLQDASGERHRSWLRERVQPGLVPYFDGDALGRLRELLARGAPCA